MKKLSLYLLIFLAIAIKGNGQNSFVLEGTIGANPVVMVLFHKQGESSYATYFYKKNKLDIEMAMEQSSAGTIILTRKEYDYEKKKDIIFEKINIQRKGNPSLNTWAGVWHGQQGNELPVNLKQIDTSKYNFPRIPDLDFENDAERIYSKARLSGMSFVVDSITRNGNYEVEWRHEPLTKIQSIRVKTGFPSLVLNRINETLKMRDFENLDSYFECRVLEGNRQGDEYDFWIKGYFIFENYLSVEARLNSYCGGAHPNADDASFTIDIKTGKEIQGIDELYSFTGKTPRVENDPAHYDYAQERGEAIVKILTELYPSQMKKPASEDDCDYSEPHNWAYPVWYFTRQGLYIGTGFPHASNNCNNPEFSFIPYAVLQQYERKR